MELLKTYIEYSDVDFRGVVRKEECPWTLVFKMTPLQGCFKYLDEVIKIFKNEFGFNIGEPTGKRGETSVSGFDFSNGDFRIIIKTGHIAVIDVMLKEYILSESFKELTLKKNEEKAMMA